MMDKLVIEKMERNEYHVGRTVKGFDNLIESFVCFWGKGAENRAKEYIEMLKFFKRYENISEMEKKISKIEKEVEKCKRADNETKPRCCSNCGTDMNSKSSKYCSACLANMVE